ncbi:MAG TPA: ester cyclase [Thermoleophilaceae bacterium]|jgi:steroid delta-isomerase-like uncharacterized protein
MSDDLIALARQEVEAFNAGDWDGLRATMTDDSVYVEPGTQRRVEGTDAVLEVNQGWKAAFPDASGTVTDAFACGDRVAIQVTWTGTQSGPLGLPGGGEVPATGRQVNIQACQVMRVADGKIAETCHFFDVLGMLEQLGALSEEALTQAG